MKKRVLSLFMALALCLTLLPTAALAEENTTEPSTQLTEPTPVPQEPKTPDQGENTETPDQPEEPSQDEPPGSVGACAPGGGAGGGSPGGERRGTGGECELRQHYGRLCRSEGERRHADAAGELRTAVHGWKSSVGL